MSEHQIVILGAGYAGMKAALRLARKTQTQITLVNAAPYFVERVRLHQRSTGQDVGLHSIADLVEGTGIKFEQGYVTALDPANRVVTVNKSGSTLALSYDTLVYALGSTIDRDSVPGVREYADFIAPDQAEVLHQKLANLTQGGRVVVCGGGLTGIETSSEIADAFPELNVTLITRGKFGTDFSEAGNKHIRRNFEKMGLILQEETEILSLTASEVVTSRGNVPYDVVIWAGAFVPSQLAKETGIQTSLNGQILVDPYLRSLSHPEIYAAGDAACPVDFSPKLRMACATALPLAQHVADNVAAKLAGEAQKPFRFGYVVRCISLGRKNGLLQVVRPDDSPREIVFGGRRGAFFKERIVKFAVWFIKKELPASRHKAAKVAKVSPLDGLPI